jgi:hypothetical protein
VKANRMAQLLVKGALQKSTRKFEWKNTLILFMTLHMLKVVTIDAFE